MLTSLRRLIGVRSRSKLSQRDTTSSSSSSVESCICVRSATWTLIGDESNTTCFDGDDCSGELSRAGDNFLLLLRLGVAFSISSKSWILDVGRGLVVFWLTAFRVMSRSCLADLLWYLDFLVSRAVWRGVKNLENRFGVIVGGFRGFELMCAVKGDDEGSSAGICSSSWS